MHLYGVLVGRRCWGLVSCEAIGGDCWQIAETDKRVTIIRMKNGLCLWIGLYLNGMVVE